MHDMIITHDGGYHADDIFAIALLYRFYFKRAVPIGRTRVPDLLEQYTTNKHIFVLDVGYKFDPGYRNFDHHMSDFNHRWLDGTLMASTGLIFEYLVQNKHIGPSVDVGVLGEFIKRVDKHDTGEEQFEICTTLSAIRDFDLALATAINILGGWINLSKDAALAKADADRIMQGIVPGQCVVELPSSPPHLLFSYLVQTPIKYVVYPSRGQYTIQVVPSLVSDVFSQKVTMDPAFCGLRDIMVVDDTGQMYPIVFVHKSGFMLITTSLDYVKLAEKLVAGKVKLCA